MTTRDRPQGRLRTEPWLSLEDDEQQTRHLIARLAHETWQAVLVGNQAPNVKARYQRMSNPRVDDLVVERSAWLQKSRATVDYVTKAVGYLVAMTDAACYVQYGPEPADICRWQNADFVAIDVGSIPAQPDQDQPA